MAHLHIAPEQLAHAVCILRQALLKEHLESCESCLAGNWVAAVCASMLPSANSQHDLHASNTEAQETQRKVDKGQK